MRAVLEIVAPVFLIIALGFGAARWRMLDDAGFRGLNAFAFGLAAPALLFAGGTMGAGGGGRAALAFFLGAGVVYLVTLLLARGRMPLGDAGMLALDASYGNTVMMGIPLITAAFGPPALPVLLAILALHSMLLLGAATVVAEVALHATAPWRRVVRATLAGVARNPIVMAVAAALLWHLAGLPPPPGPVLRTLDLLGGAVAPVSLFCLGGSLSGFRARGLWRQTALAAALKLLALPVLVWLAAQAMALSPLETAVAVTAAAMPTGANAFLMAARYRISAERSGATVLVSTLLSVLTLSVLLLGWLRSSY